MSCRYNSSDNFKAPPSIPGQRLSWKIPLRWWGRQCQCRQLFELNDHLLADIGLSRTTIEEARSSSLYERAWQDSR